MGIKKLDNGGIDSDYYRQGSNYNELMDDIFDELNIKDHPKAGLMYGLAYESGHSAGASDIWYYAQDLVELIR